MCDVVTVVPMEKFLEEGRYQPAGGNVAAYDGVTLSQILWVVALQRKKNAVDSQAGKWGGGGA